ncbi:MAG: hypothetical protein HY904_23945 [Deltaproteobacteria bacterium]|nr:hypothetical protein [Deltaproteobacteria bacterium]
MTTTKTLGHATGTDAPAGPTTFVIEGQGGIFRTVTGAVHQDEAVVALHADNPLVSLLQRGDTIRLIQADGRAWDATAHAAPASASLAAAVRARALAVPRATGTPHVFRLALGRPHGAERGHSPLT